jgi:hypothetical protein
MRALEMEVYRPTGRCFDGDYIDPAGVCDRWGCLKTIGRNRHIGYRLVIGGHDVTAYGDQFLREGRGRQR